MASPRHSERMEPALRLDLTRDPEAPAIARAAITGLCGERPIDAGALARLRLLVSEVVSNAVIHPQGAVSAAIELLARIDGDAIRIEVTDHGCGFVPRPRGMARGPSIGGYGLFLLEREAADWGVMQEDGTTVWFEMGLRGA